MNANLKLHCAMVAVLLDCGCAATNPSLMFGDTTTFGLRLGNDTASGGGSVSLGYKAQSIAAVPVSVLDERGKAFVLKGHGQSGNEGASKVDALSVFASFESAATSTGGGSNASTVQLGQVFSTGLASQVLTMGYLCRENAVQGCAQKVADRAMTESQQKKDGTDAGPSEGRGAGVVDPEKDMVLPAQATNDRPYQSPLLFLRTDAIGIDIGGSLAEQGLQFTLGYGNRNLALIPVVAQGAGGKIVKITGSNESDAGDPAADVLSVLGQFKANTETSRLGLGLGRYFATGVAARNLGDSLGVAIAKVPLPADAPASAATLAQK